MVATTRPLNPSNDEEIDDDDNDTNNYSGSGDRNNKDSLGRSGPALSLK